MPGNRPPIPAEVQREVLIEAGHRCAVCGETSALEFAHIISWSRSKDHSARNLICLCAVCHHSADTDKKKWGAKVLRQYKDTPWVARNRSSLRPLHQIPPPPADFTGRVSELADLRKALEAGGATISGVRGMGGVGKTVLALKLAEELSPLYPDGGIFLDLKGVPDEGQIPLAPAEILAHVIRTFHPEARLPEGEAELSGLYQSVLHGRRVLLLMDNATGASQVARLTPPRGCLLLVTSRAHFTLPGLVARDLDELPHEDACALLLKISPRIGTAAGEIARLCDRLPIALRLAASALAERPDLTPDSFLHQLADEKKRLGLVEGTLKLSVQLLPEELKELWCRLAAFPSSFDAGAAAAVWGLEPNPALESLGMLVRSSLLDGEDGRYHLHDLVRLFAESHLDEAARNESQARHAERYLKVVSTANDLYKKGGESLLAGLRLFDAEWANIQAGQRWASSHAAGEKRAAELARDFPGFGEYILYLRQSPREQIAWLQASLDSCRRLEDRRNEENALGNMGVAYAALGEFRRAIELYEQALAIDREIGDQRNEGNVLGNMGSAHTNLGKPRRAIEFYKQRLAIAREIGDRRGEGNVLGGMGNAYADLGETRRAIKLHEQSLAIAREIGDRHGEAHALGSMGNAYADLGEPRRAIELYEQFLAIAREIGDRCGEATACWNLGLALESQGERTRVAELMQALVDYEKAIGHPDAEAHAAQVQQIRDRLGGNESPPD